jgi:hypothetical protein
MAGNHGRMDDKVIVGVKYRLVNSWCWLVKYYRTLVIDNGRSVNDNCGLVIDDWRTVYQNWGAVYDNLWSMVHFWRRVIDYRRAVHHHIFFLVFGFGCFGFFGFLLWFGRFRFFGLLLRYTMWYT